MSESRNAANQTVSLRRALELESRRKTFATGSGAIDILLGGGLRTGELVEVYGASNSGKTQLALQTAVSVSAAGFSSVYVDTEGKFRPERIASICEARGLDAEKTLKRVYSIRAESTRRQAEVIVSLRKEPSLRDCKLVVVDTLTKNFSLELGGGSVGKRQTLLGAYLNRVARDAYLNDRAVLLLNRVASVGDGPSRTEVDIGGQTVRHFVQKAVHLERQREEVLATVDGAQTTHQAKTRITSSGLE